MTDPLPDHFAQALRSMHATEPQPDGSGQLRKIDDSTRISEEEGMALYRLVVEGGITDSLEVGLAYGFSTAYLLAALECNGGGTHTAIDPYQVGDWDGIGSGLAQRLVDASPAGLTFSWVEQPSDVALGELIRDGRSFGMTFIDGYHRFDDVLVDFTLAARLCPLEGVIVLHDMWMDSIATVAAFIRSNRSDFAEIDTGCENLFAARRVGPDTRDWTHFVAFDVGLRGTDKAFD